MSYIDLSQKKVFRMVILFIFMIGAIFLTYAYQGSYLEGFSLRYYLARGQNFLRTGFYYTQFAVERGEYNLLALVGGGSVTGSNQGKEAHSIPVLLYHGVVPTTKSAWDVSTGQFKEQMFALKQAGYQTVGLKELQEFLEGKRKLPAKSFVLTFDDGRKDSFYNTDAVLQALNYKAVMFVVTLQSIGPASSKSTYYLSEWELERMLKTGRWDIQSHAKLGHTFLPIDASGTLGSFFANKIWIASAGRLETDAEYASRVTEDLNISKNEIQDGLEIPVTSFAFPFGEFGEESGNYLQAKETLINLVTSIYPLSFYQFRTSDRFSENYPLSKNTASNGGLLIKRLELKASSTVEGLLEELKQQTAKSLPFEDIFIDEQGWFQSWGTKERTLNGLRLAAPEDTTGGAIFLDGSRGWRNYEFHTEINWISGSNVYLWARLQDDNNFTACNFSRTLVHIEQNYKGQGRVIRGTYSQIPGSEGLISLGIRVTGRTVECLFNNEVILTSDFLEPSLNFGGIGIKVWSATPGLSNVFIKNVVVKETEGPEEN